jgi:hypothetical protein
VLIYFWYGISKSADIFYEEREAPTVTHFLGNCIFPDDGRPVRPKHVALLVIKSWETKSCVELVGTDWK